jgi:hypothetical protein
MFVRGSFGDYCGARGALAAAEQENKEAAEQDTKVEA